MIILLFGPPEARAERARFRLVYKAPAGCPDESSFVQRVDARIGQASLASSADVDARPMIVEVTVQPTESTGRLELPSTEGQNVVRAVSASSCDEVVSGLALIAALSIEALAAAETRAETASASPREPRKTPAIAPARPAPPVARAFGSGAFVGLDSWSAPNFALALGVYGELAWRAPLRYARIGARRETGSATISGREATFTTWAAQLDACPLSFTLFRGLEAPACASVQLGQLSASGKSGAALPDPGSARLLWAALEASLGLRWQPKGTWLVETRASAGVPLVRHQFVFRGPEATIYEVPVVGWGATVGVGTSF